MNQKGGVVIVLVVFIIALTAVNIFIISRVELNLQPFISGGATSSQGTVFFCNNIPPTIIVNNQTVDVGEEVFTLQINASDPGGNNASLQYYDNTSLFAIDNNGYISFEPDEDTSNQFVQVIVQDESGCANQNTSANFFLNFDAVPLIAVTNPLGSINDTTPELNLTTNENAICLFRHEENSTFTIMDVTDGTTHSQTLPSLNANSEHEVFVRCNDSRNNVRAASLKFMITDVTVNVQNLTTVNITANATQTIILLPQLNITANISQTLKQQSFSAAEFNSTPLNSSFSVTGSDTTSYKYYSISADNKSSHNINKLTLKFTYNQAELTAAGIAESDLELFSYNISSTAWQEESETIDTGNNILESNITHLTTFVLGSATQQAEALDAVGTPGGGGGGGGGGSSKKKPTGAAVAAKGVVKELPGPVHLPGILFDVSVNIPEKYRKVLLGQELAAEVRIINIKTIGTVAVTMEYIIEDKGGNTLFDEFETKVIENEIEYLKQIILPADIPPGVYMFFVKVKYQEDTALAGYPFEVVEENKPLFGLAVPMLTYKQAFRDYSAYLLGFIVFFAALLVVIYFMKRKRIPKCSVGQLIAKLS